MKLPLRFKDDGAVTKYCPDCQHTVDLLYEVGEGMTWFYCADCHRLIDTELDDEER